jgi:hypothetical protein
MLPIDLKELLLVFNANNVEYLVVGGHVVGLHAEPRATKDLDIFIRASKKNSEAIYLALAQYGAPLSEVTPEVFNDGKSAFQIGVEPYRIDLLSISTGSPLTKLGRIVWKEYFQRLCRQHLSLGTT